MNLKIASFWFVVAVVAFASAQKRLKLDGPDAERADENLRAKTRERPSGPRPYMEESQNSHGLSVSKDSMGQKPKHARDNFGNPQRRADKIEPKDNSQSYQPLRPMK